MSLFGSALVQCDCCPHKRRRKDTEADAQVKYYVKMETEVGGLHMPRNAKDYQQPQKLREKYGTDSPLEPSEMPCDSLIADVSSLEDYCVVWSHPVCDALLWKPKKANKLPTTSFQWGPLKKSPYV